MVLPHFIWNITYDASICICYINQSSNDSVLSIKRRLVKNNFTEVSKGTYEVKFIMLNNGPTRYK